MTYPKDLETVWETAFQALNPELNPDHVHAGKLLQLLCILSPEAVPQTLFSPTETSYLLADWDLLREDLSFDEAKVQLLDLALIKFDQQNGLVSTHRLIQQAFWDWMDQSSRTDAFDTCSKLLRNAFPRRTGFTHLYKRWAACEPLHQHVLSLVEAYKNLDDPVKMDVETQELIQDDAAYMLETQQFLNAEKVLLYLKDHQVEANSLKYAHIQQDLMTIYERTGRSIKAVQCAEAEFKILKPLYENEESNTLANAYSDMGYSLCSAFRSVEALEYLDGAIRIAKSHDEPACYKNFNIDRFLRNRGRAKVQLKRYDDALADFAEAEGQL